MAWRVVFKFFFRVALRVDPRKGRKIPLMNELDQKKGAQKAPFFNELE